MNEIEHWYDEKYDEWERLNRHKIEFDITKRYFDNFIIGEGLEIIDIGGGPGRYAMNLAEKGHKVTLLDLSKRNLKVAKEKAASRGLDLKDYIHGNALDLSSIQKKFDVVLLMGPLYHLVSEADRQKAVQEALNILKPNGLIFATFISNYAPIQDNLKDLVQIESVDRLLNYLTKGENKADSGFTTAYFTSQQEAQSLMASYGLEEIIFAGIENILGSKEKEINMLEESQYKKWLELGFRLSTDQNVIGTSQHFLYIGRKF